jgi:hypothetical protein
MLTKGIQLTLLMGPVVVVPAPRMVIDALDSVEVTSAAGSASGFKLTFQFSSKSDLNQLFLITGFQGTPVAPGLRIILIVTLNGTPQPLFDGVITYIEAQPGSSGSAGAVTIYGDDLTRMMDTIDWSGLPFPALPIEARVALICAKYAIYGLIPMVIPVLFPDIPIPIESIPAQEGTDLAYIQQLAEDVGYVFYVEPGPAIGTNIAYFGPEIKVGIPQPALNVDMDALTNVESLTFSLDTDKGVLPIVFIQNEATRLPIPIPIPKLNPLQPPLAALSTPIANVIPLSGTAKLKPLQALAAGVAVAAASRDAVQAKGNLDVLRYGHVLKARQLVGVRGAGLAFDGVYFVSGVTSLLKRGSFKQSFALSRNGIVSLTPKVMP